MAVPTSKACQRSLVINPNGLKHRSPTYRIEYINSKSPGKLIQKLFRNLEYTGKMDKTVTPVLQY